MALLARADIYFFCCVQAESGAEYGCNSIQGRIVPMACAKPKTKKAVTKKKPTTKKK